VTTLPRPSVGRIVHYVSRGSADGRYPSVCRAAVITALTEHPTLFVDLCVLNPEGLYFLSGAQAQPAEDRVPGTWHWPERVDE
jgi:hypothetical protein